MDESRINFQNSLRKIVIPAISPLGYEKFVPPKGLKDSRLTFFRKHLFDNTYAYIMFQLRRWAPMPPNMQPMPRSFWITLIRNPGDEPDLIPREYPYYLNMSLSHVLWAVLGIYKYQRGYHEWKYFTADELDVQLQMAAEDLVNHGIPWLEDLKSKNQY